MKLSIKLIKYTSNVATHIYSGKDKITKRNDEADKIVKEKIRNDKNESINT